MENSKLWLEYGDMYKGAWIWLECWDMYKGALIITMLEYE